MTQFLMLTFVAALMIISPGPDFAIVVKNSLSNGRVAGLAAALGIALANLCHVSINLLGIGVIIAKSVLLFTGMKVLGAAYLMYLGVKGICARATLQSKKLESLDENTKPLLINNNVQTSPLKLVSAGFYSGLLTSLLNPKACLFFLSFFSVILSPSTPILTQVSYGVWISFMALLWFMLVAVFFTSPVIAENINRFKHWLERFTGGILVLLGIKLLSSEVVP